MPALAEAPSQPAAALVAPNSQARPCLVTPQLSLCECKLKWQLAPQVPRPRLSPLGPFIRLTSMMVSGGGCLRLTSSLTTGPASFSASTALLCTTSETSTSLTLSTQSLTLRHGAGGEGGRAGPSAPAHLGKSPSPAPPDHTFPIWPCRVGAGDLCHLALTPGGRPWQPLHPG